MSAAHTKAQLVIGAEHVLRSVRMQKVPKHSLMQAVLHLLPDGYTLESVRLWRQDAGKSHDIDESNLVPLCSRGRGARGLDDIDAFFNFEGNACYAAYAVMIKAVNAKEGKRVTYEDVVKSIREVMPKWKDVRVAKASTAMWVVFAGVLSWGSPVSEVVERLVEAKISRAVMAS